MHKLKWLSLLVVFILIGCAGIPKGVEPVDKFEVEKYLGKWYEIARLDHSFERGLTKVSAEYSERDDGGLDVLNRGYNPDTEQWEEAKGKAYFVKERDIGRLKVTFFWPFYGGYNIIDLDEEYTHSLVCGPSRQYLWILSRDNEMEEKTYDRLVKKADALKFNIQELIKVQH